MDELSKVLLTAAGSALGAALVSIFSQHLKNRREDRIKYGEACQRLLELRGAQDKHLDKMTQEERAAFLEKYNRHSEWMTGISAYLTVQQREDIHILKVSLIHTGNERSPHDEARFKRWMQAEERVFPTFTQLKPLKRWRGKLKVLRWRMKQKGKVE